MYLGGGLAPKLLSRLKTVLTTAYLDDPVMGGMLSTFPLYAVLNDDVGLLGARVRAVQLVNDD